LEKGSTFVLQSGLSTALWLASLPNAVVWVFSTWKSPAAKLVRAALIEVALLEEALTTNCSRIQAEPNRVHFIDAPKGAEDYDVGKFLTENAQLKVSGSVGDMPRICWIRFLQFALVQIDETGPLRSLPYAALVTRGQAFVLQKCDSLVCADVSEKWTTALQAGGVDMVADVLVGNQHRFSFAFRIKWLARMLWLSPRSAG
jgi:hypothetical protein